MGDRRHQGRGQDLTADGLEAALLLPMGRKGPAFLAYPNFYVFLDWNSSLVYSTSAAWLSRRGWTGAEVSRGSDPARSASTRSSSSDDPEQEGLRRRQDRRHHRQKTREAVRDVQLKLGLPADSYPTQEASLKLG
jgi:hypothetical protein